MTATGGGGTPRRSVEGTSDQSQVDSVDDFADVEEERLPRISIRADRFDYTDVAPRQPRRRPPRTLAARIARTFDLDASPQVAGLRTLSGGDPARWDVALLLSVLGARQTTDPAEFKRLTPIHLRSFEEMQRNASGVRVLSGMIANRTAPDVALMPIGQVPSAWARLRPVDDDVPGLLEHTQSRPPGPWMLWLKVGNQPSETYVTHLLPNRVTLLVLTDSMSRQVRLHQYVLPVAHLTQYLDGPVLGRWLDNAPQLMRSIYLAQRRFADRQPIDPAVPGGDWAAELIYQKWADPVMGLIAAYDMVRAGLSGPEGEIRRVQLREAVSNLRRFFPGLPDTEAIARLIGEPSGPLPTPPMLTDGGAGVRRRPRSPDDAWIAPQSHRLRQPLGLCGTAFTEVVSATPTGLLRPEARRFAKY